MIDFGAIISQLFSSFWWAIPLFVLIAIFKSAWFKGFIGEVMVNMAARLLLGKNVYHLIKNVIIPTEDGIMIRAKQLNNLCLNIPLEFQVIFDGISLHSYKRLFFTSVGG